jgi:hypothetical protein
VEPIAIVNAKPIGWTEASAQNAPSNIPGQTRLPPHIRQAATANPEGGHANAMWSGGDVNHSPILPKPKYAAAAAKLINAIRNSENRSLSIVSIKLMALKMLLAKS